jgi:hypothetical protein
MGRLPYFWNPSRQIRVEFIFDSDITSVSVDELKERLLESFAGRPANMAAWNPGTINFEQFKEGLKSAQTFDEVLGLVREFTTIRPELLYTTVKKSLKPTQARMPALHVSIGKFHGMICATTPTGSSLV